MDAVARGLLTQRFTPPRMFRHNGKVKLSHYSDQRYFYDWEKFSTVQELNQKLNIHLSWSNNKPMRTLGWNSPLELLAAAIGSHH